MKKKISILATVVTLTMPFVSVFTTYAEEKEVTPEFQAEAILTDEGMTDDYTYTMETGKVDVASKESALMVNGEFVTNKGVMKDGTTFVPVRVISESFGKEVKWNNATQQVTIEDIVLTINDTNAKDGAENVKLTKAPFVEKGVTYVPLRFIAESLDKEVGYVPKNTKNAYLHNSIVWVESKDKLDNNGYEVNEVIEWLKPQLYTNKDFFYMHGNTEGFTQEGVENMEYLGQLGRYSVFDVNSDHSVLVDMYTKSVYFYYGGMGYSAIVLQIKDGAYYIYELDMIVDLPDEVDGKYYIGKVEYSQDRANPQFGIYHKGSADKEDGYGLIGTVLQMDKQYSTHNNPIMAGGSFDLYSTENWNYMFRLTSDLQGYIPDEKVLEEYFKVQEIVTNHETLRNSVSPISSEVIPLDYPYKATNEFFFGTWKVDKFLGIGEVNTTKDDTEQPNGYDIVGKEVVLGYDDFDTTSFDKYPQFQYKSEYPAYEANTFGFVNGEGVDFGVDADSQIIEVKTFTEGNTNEQIRFYVVDDSRLIMRVGERTWYELTKVKAPAPNVYDRPGIILFSEFYEY